MIKILQILAVNLPLVLDTSGFSLTYPLAKKGDITGNGALLSGNQVIHKGLLHVKGENGTLQIQANNINLTGADILNDGQGQTYLSAKNHLNLTAPSVGFDEKMGGGNHYRNEAVQSVEISRVQGNVVLSGNNIYSEGAALEAKQRLALLAENDVVLGTASARWSKRRLCMENQ